MARALWQGHNCRSPPNSKQGSSSSSEPFLRPEQDGPEINDHPPVGSPRSPPRASAPCRAMPGDGRDRLRPVWRRSQLVGIRQRCAGVLRDRPPSHRPRPSVSGGTPQRFPQRVSQDFMRAFPDDERRSIRARLDHRNAEQEAVRSRGRSAAAPGLRHEAIEMGGGAVAAISKGGWRFGRHRLWIARIANGYLALLQSQDRAKPRPLRMKSHSVTCKRQAPRAPAPRASFGRALTPANQVAAERNHCAFSGAFTASRACGKLRATQAATLGSWPKCRQPLVKNPASSLIARPNAPKVIRFVLCPSPAIY